MLQLSVWSPVNQREARYTFTLVVVGGVQGVDLQVGEHAATALVVPCNVPPPRLGALDGIIWAWQRTELGVAADAQSWAWQTAHRAGRGSRRTELGVAADAQSWAWQTAHRAGRGSRRTELGVAADAQSWAWQQTHTQRLVHTICS